MACTVCKEPGHDRRNCPLIKKNPAEIELQLKNRRFALDALNSVTELLKVPMVTAGVWFALSRNEPTLGVLNKAILAAEMAPIIGDIKFPEGVLLGAAIESVEDFVDILNAAGVLTAPFNPLYQSAITTGGGAANWLNTLVRGGPGIVGGLPCAVQNQLLWMHYLHSIGRKQGPGAAEAYAKGTPIPLVPDLTSTSKKRAKAFLDFASAIKSMKKGGCDRPTYPYEVDSAAWDKINV